MFTQLPAVPTHLDSLGVHSKRALFSIHSHAWKACLSEWVKQYSPGTLHTDGLNLCTTCNLSINNRPYIEFMSEINTKGESSVNRRKDTLERWHNCHSRFNRCVLKSKYSTGKSGQSQIACIFKLACNKWGWRVILTAQQLRQKYTTFKVEDLRNWLKQLTTYLWSWSIQQMAKTIMFHIFYLFFKGNLSQLIWKFSLLTVTLTALNYSSVVDSNKKFLLDCNILKMWLYWCLTMEVIC